MFSFHARWCLCWILLRPKQQIPPVFYYSLFQHAHLLQRKRHLLLQWECMLSALSCKWIPPSCVCQEWYLLCWLKTLLKIVQLFGSTDLKQNMNVQCVFPFSLATSCFKRSNTSVNLGLSESKWIFRIVFQLSGRCFWRTEYFYNGFTPIISVFLRRCQKDVPNFTNLRKIRQGIYVFLKQLHYIKSLGLCNGWCYLLGILSDLVFVCFQCSKKIQYLLLHTLELFVYICLFVFVRADWGR